MVLELEDSLTISQVAEVSPAVVLGEECVHPQTNTWIASSAWIQAPQTLVNNKQQQHKLSSPALSIVSCTTMIAVACRESVECFTTASLEPLYSLALANVRELAFCGDEILAVVTSSYSLELYNNHNGVQVTELFPKETVRCCCAMGTNTMMAVGCSDGRVEIVSLQNNGQQHKTLTTIPAPPSVFCSYVSFWGRGVLAVGYENVETQDVSLHVVEMDPTTSVVSKTTELGEVVPFFREEEEDVHKFWSCPLLQGRMIVIAANLGTDLGIVVRRSNVWETLDMAEPYELATFQDEFMHPVGVAQAKDEEDEFYMAITDGSIVKLKIQTDDPDFQPNDPDYRPSPEPTLIQEVEESSPPKKDAQEIQKTKVPEKAAAPAFGVSVPAFGSTTTRPLGLGGATFGTGGKTPTFGSGGAIPSFGSTSMPLFGSGKASPFASGGASPFATPATTTTNPFQSPFASSSSPSHPKFSMAKPLFGDSTATKTETVVAPPEKKNLETRSSPKIVELPSELSIRASQAFDAIDTDKTGLLPIHRLEDLCDQVGEGLYGDELERQASQLDPTGAGTISRKAFIEWYELLAAADQQADSDEEEEMAQEREKAKNAFVSIASDGEWISPDDFPKVIESLGSTYCEEDHAKTIRKLSVEGKIRLQPFLEWYIDWLFGESDEDDESEADEPEQVASNNTAEPAGIWGQQPGSANQWTCAVCDVSNDDSKVACAACETPRPGHTKAPAAQASGAPKIGSGGFSFDGGAKATSGVGSSGFSFASAAKPSGAATIGSGGFSFGSPPSGAAETGSGGFAFGGAPKSTDLGFSTAPVDAKPATGFSLKPASSGSQSEPPAIVAESEFSKRAASAFDDLDVEKTGSLPISSLEDLLDQVGEGLHGDEMDRQAARLDPTSSGKITRSAFIQWYEALATEQDNDDEASDDDEEKAEERLKAIEAFLSIASEDKDWIHADDFPKVIESLGSTYCEEDHVKTVGMLSTEGKIHLKPFLEWYIDWLFGDSDDDDSESGEPEQVLPKTNTAPAGIWAQQSSSTQWICAVCDVSNDENKVKCASCETPRPGHADKAAADDAKSIASSALSGIGSGGFSFGGGVPPKSGGFSFGSGTDVGTGASGFSFGSGALSDKANVPAFSAGVSGGFSFASPSPGTGFGGFSLDKAGAASPATKTAPPKPSGFSFVSSNATTGFAKPISGTDKPAKPLTAGMPPMSSKAPKSLTASIPPMATTAPKPLNASMPPMAKTAPKPLSASMPPMAKAAPKPLSASMPPMAKAAPKPLAASMPPMAKIAPKPLAASMPPMAKAAPKPLAASTPPMAKTAPKPLAASMPPMAKTAQKPLVASMPPIAKTAPKPLAASIPPMAKAAPKPLSSGASPGFLPVPSKGTTSAFSSFSPFTTTATTSPQKPAFGSSFAKNSASNPALTGSSVASSKLTSSTSSPFGFPPKSDQVPKQSNKIGGTSAFHQTPSRSKRDSTQHIPDTEPMSAETVEYIALVRQMEAVLSTASRDLCETNEHLKPFVREKTSVLCNTELVGSKLHELKNRVAELLSSKSESLRLLGEIKVLIENLEDNGNGSDSLNNHPLDSRSKAQQQKLFGLFEACNSLVDLVNKKSTLFLDNGAVTDKLKYAVVGSYSHSKKLKEKAKKMKETSQTSVVVKSSKRRSLMQLEGTGLNWESLEESIQYIAPPRVKKFSLQAKQLPDPGRRGTRFENKFSTPLAGRKSAEPVLSPPLSTAARPRWSETTTDQDKLKELSLNPPNELHAATLESGVKSVLLKYGTTPEKLQKSFAIEKESTVSAQRLSPKKNLPVFASPQARAPEKSLPVLPDDNQGISVAPRSSNFASGNLDGGLPSLAPKATPPRPSKISAPESQAATTQSIAAEAGKPGYRSIMAEFYERHAPDKMATIDSLLAKYKGREEDMFEKLAKKYKAPNPLSDLAASTPQGGNSPTPPFGTSTATPPPAFPASGASPFSNPPAPNAISASSPFPSAPPAGQSPFSSSPSPFSSMPTNTSTPTAVSPFGAPQAAPTPSAKTYAGKTAREILVACFEKYNPQKLPTVDSVLAKYSGNEEQMILGLAKKYKFDASEFGLQAAPATPAGAAGFGQPSPLGGAPAFGSPAFGKPSPLGGAAGASFGSPAFGQAVGGNVASSPAPFGSTASTFGSGFGSGGGGASGFGALASSAGATSFGTPTPFSSPFGAPRK